MRRAALALFLIAGAAATYAAGSSEKGTSAADFLKVGVGARPMAMGEAYTALADDALALSWNSAGLTRTKRFSAVLAHTSYLESINHEYAAAAVKFPLIGLAVGGALQFQTVGDLTGRDSGGAETGSVTPGEKVFTLGAAQSFGLVSIGLSGKLLKSEIQESADTVAIDAGVMTGPLLGNALRLGATASNLGGKLKYEETSDPLPVTYRAGAAFTFMENLTLSADVVLPRDNDTVFALGGEVLLPVAGGWSLAFRGGYNSRLTDDLDGLSGVSAGLGFGVKALQVDYALVPLGDLGLTHRISLSFHL